MIATTFFLIFIGCISTLNSAAILDNAEKEQIRETAKMVILDCQQKTGASLVDIESIRSRKLPQTHSGLCMIECFFDEGKIMSNGKFSKSGLVNAFTPLLKNDTGRLNKLKELSEVCDKEIGNGDKDKCVTAKLLVECIEKNGKRYGFAIPPTTS